MTESRQVLLSAGMIQSGKSGVGRYVIELSRHLMDLPGCPRLLLCGLEADRHLFPWIPNEQWLPIPASAASGARNLLWHQVSLPGLLRKADVSLVHIPSYRRILARCPVPQLATIHDCAPFHLRDKYGFMRGLFGRTVVPFLARRCGHVVTVSHATSKDLQGCMNLPPDRISVIWNGIDEERFRPLPESEVRDFRRKNQLGERVFLYIARLEHPGKNHLRLIEAFEQVCASGNEEGQLVLGGADWHGAEAIHQRVRQSPCRDRIRMAGFLRDDEIPLWYGSAFALVFPSLFEGFGLPVAEAMACGTRVISSDRGSLAEVGGDAANFVNPESVEEMKEAMVAVLEESESERLQWLERGMVHVRQFSWRTAAERTCTIYRALLDGRDT